MATPPKYHMIIPDRSLRESTLHAATSQGGIKGNVAYGSTSNNGSMKLFLNGRPTSDETYEFLINNSGSINESTFIWKKETEQIEEYRGENDLRFIHDSHSPFLNYGTEHCTASYIENLDRELLYNKYDDETIKVYYRTSSDTYGNYTWSNQVIDISSISGFGIDGSFDVCNLNDGIIMCIVNDNDIHIYQSDDGLSFTLLSGYIFSRLAGHRVYPLNIKIASSGNFLRIIFSSFPYSQSYVETLFSIVSSDSGASWTITNSFGLDGHSDNSVLTGKYFTADRYVYDICNYDDSGTFIISMLEQSSGILSPATDIKTYTAYSNQPYFENSDLVIKCQTPQNVFLTNSPDYLMAFVIDKSNDFDNRPSTSMIRYVYEYKIFYKKKNSDMSDGWISLNGEIDTSNFTFSFTGDFGKTSITGFLGQGNKFTKIGKLVSTGSNIFLFGSMFDISSFAFERTTSYLKLSGWSNRPAYDQNYFNYILNVGDIPTFDQLELIKSMISVHQPFGRFMIAQWNYINGIPAGGYDSGSDTPWQVFRTNCLAYSQNSSMSIIDLSSSGQCVFRYIDPHILDGSDSNPNYRIAFGPLNMLTRNADSPPTNWFFIPRNDNSVYPESNLHHGSCIRWVMKVTGGTTSSTSCFVRINGFVSRDASISGTRYTRIQVVVRLAETGLVVRDEIASSNLATLTPDSGIYGVTPFSDEFWEFRWAWYPQKGDIFTGDIASCVLVCRKLGTNSWLSTSIVQPSKESSVSYPSSDVDKYRQAVQFGHLTATSSQRSYWREFGVHAGNDMATFRLSDADFTDVPIFNDLPRPQAYRGRLTSQNPLLLTDKTKAVWGGAGAFDSDSYTADIAYSYSALNVVKYDSPRVSYRSEESFGSGTVNLDFKAPDNEVFYHSAISLFDTNCSTATIQYSDDGASWVSSSIISFSQGIGTVDSASGNKLSVTFDDSYSITNSKFSSDDKKTFYLKVKQAAGGAIWSNNDQYKIDRMYGQDTLMLSSGVTQLFDSSVVGSTVYIYSNRGHDVYNSPVAKKYMRIKLTSSSNFMPDGYAKLGSVIAGTTYTFDVPLSWEYTDDEQPNVELMRSRGNVSWGYKLGPAARNLELSMIGDVSSQKRREFRDLTRTTMNYSQYGAVLINNANNDDPDNIFFGRLLSGSNNENVGFYYDSNLQRWLPIGDLSLQFEEII